MLSISSAADRDTKAALGSLEPLALWPQSGSGEPRSESEPAERESQRRAAGDCQTQLTAPGPAILRLVVAFSGTGQPAAAAAAPAPPGSGSGTHRRPGRCTLTSQGFRVSWFISIMLVFHMAPPRPRLSGLCHDPGRGSRASESEDEELSLSCEDPA